MKKTLTILLAIILSTSLLQGGTPRQENTQQSYGYTQDKPAVPGFATVPGYKVVLNKTHAHYIALEGTGHFCITREQYNFRLSYEREVKRLERERRSVQRDLERLEKSIRK